MAATQPGSADETILASARPPQPVEPSSPLESADPPMPRLFDVPTATAEDAVVPEPESRQRYPARMMDPLPPQVAPASVPVEPSAHVDGESVARRNAQLRRRQAVWVIGAAVAASALALAALVLVVLFT